MKKKNIDYVGKEVPAEKDTVESVKVADDKTPCVYSRLLNKPFATMEELKKAEDDYKAKYALELKAKEERKAEAKKIEEAYLKLQDAKRQARELIKKAEDDYLELRNAFAEKYGSYHMTYVNDGNKEQISFGDVIDSFFDIDKPMLPLFKDFFDRW